jgi:YggT family protein
MMALVLATFTDLFVTIFEVLLIIRVVMSYFAGPGNRFYAALLSLTEPLLVPVRRVVPPLGGADLAPLIMFFILQGIQLLVHSVLGV